MKDIETEEQENIPDLLWKDIPGLRWEDFMVFSEETLWAFLRRPCDLLRGRPSILLREDLKILWKTFLAFFGLLRGRPFDSKVFSKNARKVFHKIFRSSRRRKVFLGEGQRMRGRLSKKTFLVFYSITLLSSTGRFSGFI